MNKLPRLFLLGVALAAPLMASATITRTVEKTFSVQPDGRLNVTTQGGNITIKTSDSLEVRILVRQVVRASNEKEADEILKKQTLTLEKSGNEVTAESRYEKRDPGSWFGSGPSVTVSFEVTVPQKFNLNLNTSGGNIAVASVHGKVYARTSGGNLDFSRIEGDLDGDTSGGNISLKEGTARTLLRTSGGNIQIDRAGGPTDVSTSGGNIRINSVAQLIRATTSGGNVQASITEPLKQDALLSTSGGGVDVNVVPGAGFMLDASGGDVNASGLTITLEKGGTGKGRMVGAVNGGGPRLTLHSSGGAVTIHSR